MDFFVCFDSNKSGVVFVLELIFDIVGDTCVDLCDDLNVDLVVTGFDQVC